MNQKQHFTENANLSAFNTFRADDNLARLHEKGVTGQPLEDAELDLQLAAALWAEAGRRADRVTQGLPPDPFPTKYYQPLH